MKKVSIGIGVFGIIFLLISMTTTVPATQSTPLMTSIDKIESLEREVESISDSADMFPTDGIIDLLIQLIMVVVNLIIEIVKIVQNIITLLAVIQALIDAAQLLFDMIGQLIDLISQIFNPEPLIG